MEISNLDVMTKIVSGAQDKRLAVRFYNDVDLPLQLPNNVQDVGDEMMETSQQEKQEKWWILLQNIDTGFWYI